MAQISGPRVYGFLFGNTALPITETMVNYWVVIAFTAILCLFLTHRMQKIPKPRQALAEKAVLMVDALVEGNMGARFRHYSPYIATLLLSSVFGSLTSLFGLRSVTADLNTTLGWAIITSFLVIYNKIKYRGVGGYVKSFAKPNAIMLPLNLLGIVSDPVSMAFRHFGNIGGDLVITTLMMSALAALSGALHLPLPLFQIGIPGILGLYFDLFSACIQAFIFCMLTMTHISAVDE